MGDITLALGGTRARFALLGAGLLTAMMLLAIALAPASAQADPVRSGNCTAQVTGAEGENNATFTIVCEGEGRTISQAEFTTSEGAVILFFQGE